MTVPTLRLLVSCPDRRGIIAAVAKFIQDHRGNIVDVDQHTDAEHAEFFMRAEIELGTFALGPDEFSEAWEPLARDFDMQWRIHWGNATKKMAILVSKESHCLNDLLWRQENGELDVRVPLVIGNHPELAASAGRFGVEFLHLPVTPKTKSAQEQAILDRLREVGVDFVVLARYMQILSADFISHYPDRVINIHHSFLPAFAGARPYHQAYERGVKIIGATSHYVTETLDRGPIIAQATVPIDHREDVADLVRKGRDLERVVLADAVRLHVEDRILVNRNKTVVFD